MSESCKVLFADVGKIGHFGQVYGVAAALETRPKKVSKPSLQGKTEALKLHRTY